jgi:hypothetical protein
MDDRRIYLDHNASTPIDVSVRAAMAPYLGAVRFSLGRSTTWDELDAVVEGLAITMPSVASFTTAQHMSSFSRVATGASGFGSRSPSLPARSSSSAGSS